MWSIVEYLKKPELVVTVQEWFGVEYDDNSDKQNEKEHTFYGQNNKSPNLERNQYSEFPEHKKHRRKQINDDCVSNTKKSETESVHADASRSYQITNKFWYYLFLFGTELGDEIFYATMIPFWFWNIDGAVGRRVGKNNSKMNLDLKRHFEYLYHVIVCLVNVHSFCMVSCYVHRTGFERYYTMAKTGSTSSTITKQMVHRIWNALDSCNGSYKHITYIKTKKFHADYQHDIF